MGMSPSSRYLKAEWVLFWRASGIGIVIPGARPLILWQCINFFAAQRNPLAGELEVSAELFNPFVQESASISPYYTWTKRKTRPPIGIFASTEDALNRRVDPASKTVDCSRFFRANGSVKKGPRYFCLCHRVSSRGPLTYTELRA